MFLWELSAVWTQWGRLLCGICSPLCNTHSPETPPPQAPCQEPEQRVSRALVTNCLETYEDVVMTSRPSGFQGWLKEETPGGMQGQAWRRSTGLGHDSDQVWGNADCGSHCWVTSQWGRGVKGGVEERDFPAGQWRRICLAMQRTRVWSLLGS